MAKYKEEKPEKMLAPFIDAFWNVDNIYDNWSNTIIPDSYADIIIKISSSKRCLSISDIFTVGIMTEPVTTSALKGDKFIGARLSCFALKNLLNIDMSEITDKKMDLKSVNLCLYNKIKNIFMYKNQSNDINESFKNLIKKELHFEGYETVILIGIIKKIRNCFGNINIEGLAEEFSLSIRSLQRLFKEYIGVSPKKYARIIRFKKAYDILKSDSFIKPEEYMFDLGYYDQPHFINEIKKFSNKTPGIF
jgi:AraC-like DNA-binding protein